MADVDVDDYFLVNSVLRCTSCYTLRVLLEAAALFVARRSHFIQINKLLWFSENIEK